jgi:c-di-AMP phosphodiesterase-like protein
MTAQGKNQRVQINLDLSSELYETLNNLAEQINGDNAEVLLKAMPTVGYVYALIEAKEKGKYIWIADDNQNIETDLSKTIANKSDNKLIISTVNLQSQEDAELERKLRELKFKQELRKDWILFIVRDVVIFPAAILFIFAVSGYSLFTQIYR